MGTVTALGSARSSVTVITLAAPSSTGFGAADRVVTDFGSSLSSTVISAALPGAGAIV